MFESVPPRDPRLIQRLGDFIPELWRTPLIKAAMNGFLKIFPLLMFLGFYWNWRPKPMTEADYQTIEAKEGFRLNRYPGTYRAGTFFVVSPLVNAGYFAPWVFKFDLGFVWYEAGRVGFCPPLFWPWEKI